MALVIAPFHRHKLACRGICQEIFSPPAPAGAEIFGWPVSRGSQKRSPLAKLLRSGAKSRSGLPPPLLIANNPALTAGAAPHSRIFGPHSKCTKLQGSA